MLDSVLELWRDLPGVFRVSLDFIFTVVIVRGILAREIMDWLKEHGIMKDGLLHSLAGFSKKILPNHNRHSAIFAHYREHGENPVTSCNQGGCQIFTT